MARIAGVDLPKNKRGEIGLTYIYGIGPSTAKYILDKNNIDRNKKVHEWKIMKKVYGLSFFVYGYRDSVFGKSILKYSGYITINNKR